MAKKNNHLFQILYGIMVVCLLVILFWAGLYFDGLQMREELTRYNYSVEEDWVLADGSTADLSHLQKLPGVEPYQKSSVFFTLPQDLGDGKSLCFRSKNINYRVYIDGEYRYEPYHEYNVVYLKSQGTRWNFIPLTSKDAGATVEIRFETVYDNATACIDHVVLGLAAGQILDIVAEKAVAAVTAGLIVIFGLFLTIMDIPVNMQREKNHELLHLGIFAMMLGLWCFTETNLIQLINGDSRMVQLLSCCLLSMLSLPLMLYLDTSLEQKPQKLIKGICCLSVLQFTICTVLHFLGIADYHETLTLAHIVLVLSALVLFITSFKNTFVFAGEEENRLYQWLRAIGMICIAVSTFIDVLRFYRKSGGDNAMFIRFGIFLFVVCYGASSMKRTIDAVKKGAHMEFVSQLAYMDGLTGIGNRTAFQEKMEDWERRGQEKLTIGIAIFDVNNLKKVNDSLGHNIGDQMIQKSAEVIKTAFEPERGDCYRIGGDEFAVLIEGKKIPERYRKALQKMTDELAAYNKEEQKSYELQIASGYAIYNGEDADKTLMDIFETADAKMYENKKKMKKIS